MGIGILHATFSFHQTIGTQQQLNVYCAELYAIYQAVLSIRPYIGGFPERRNRRMIVFSDSQAALKAIAHPRQQSGQFILHNLLSGIEEIRRWTGVEVELRWVPAHAGVTPNEVVHEISRLATQGTRTPQQIHLPRLVTKARREAMERAASESMASRDRTFFQRHIDQAMPRRSMSVLYDQWSKGDASILSQLRTGKGRLNHYLARIGATELEACECGRETKAVSHFLSHCPRWEEIRRDLQVYALPRW